MKLLRDRAIGQVIPRLLDTQGRGRDLSGGSVKGDWAWAQGSVIGSVIGSQAFRVSRQDAQARGVGGRHLRAESSRCTTRSITRHRARTRNFSAAHRVSYVSRFMSLEFGDLITFVTPPGVGIGAKPSPVFSKPGDKMRPGIEGLAVHAQTVYAWDPARMDG